MKLIKFLKVCEIRFAETSSLQNYGTVQCSISNIQDSATDKAKAQVCLKTNFRCNINLNTTCMFSFHSD